MSKINLTAALAMKNSVGNINAIKGIGFSWAKPISGIADYYGIGPGQIPIDLRLDDPTSSGGLVTAARNDGGAGSAFAASASGAERPTAGTGFVSMSNSSMNLTLASPADLNGVHMFLPVRLRNHTTATRFPRPLSNASNAIFLNLTNGMAGTRSSTSGHPLAAVDLPVGAHTFSAWHLFEFRYAGGVFSVYRDGAQVGTVSLAQAAFLLSKIGGTNSGQWFDADIGRSVSLIANGGSEPAIPIIRNTLAAQYGITL